MLLVFLYDNKRSYYPKPVGQFRLNNRAYWAQRVPCVIIDIPIESHGRDCIIKVLARVA